MKTLLPEFSKKKFSCHIQLALFVILFLDTGHLKSQEPDNTKGSNTTNKMSAYFDFYFAKGDDYQWKTVCQDVNAHFLSTANSFGFTGTTIGMYATSKHL